MTLSICDSCIQAADTDNASLHCNDPKCACLHRHGETKLRQDIEAAQKARFEELKDELPKPAGF